MRRSVSVTFLFLLAMAWGDSSHAEVPAPVADRSYTQTLRLTFESATEAQAASLEITPVPGGRLWAVSARWDDSRKSNEQMAELLAKHDWPGTFYLNETGSKEGWIGTDYVQTLIAPGNDIGGHSQTHDVLTALRPNEMFFDILANRIEKEGQADRPINSFAYPFGRFDSKGDERVQEAMALAFLASGYHHSTYPDFKTDNPSLKDAELSVSLMTRPGDRNVDAKRYAGTINGLMADREKLQADTHSFYLGIHVSYRDEGWNDIDALLGSYARRDDWWYGTLTQYAAYELQRRRTVIEKMGVAGSTATWRITRPTPAVLGADVAMTLEVSGGALRDASADAGEVQTLQEPGRVLVDVEAPDEQLVPTTISVFENTKNAKEASSTEQTEAVLRGHLYCDEAKQTLELTLTNVSGQSLAGLDLTWRLPPMYAANVVAEKVDSLGAGQSVTLMHALGQRRPSDWLGEGRAYFAVECDVEHDGVMDRVWATTRLPAAGGGVLNVCDASQMLGPIPGAEATPQAVVAMSKPKAVMADLGKEAWKQWFTADAVDRERYAAERVTLYRQHDKAWNKQMSSAINKPRDFMVSLNFELSDAATLSIDSELPVAEVYLNGVSSDASSSLSGQVGSNRMILRLQTRDDRSGFKPYPAFLKITPSTGSLTYDSPPTSDGVIAPSPSAAKPADGPATMDTKGGDEPVELLPPLSHVYLRSSAETASQAMNGDVCEVEIKQAGKWHAAQLVLKPKGQWKAGETLALNIEARATQVSDESGEGWMVMAFQQSKSPFAKALRVEHSVPQQWTTLQYPFEVTDQFLSGQSEVIIGLGNRKQKLEVRRVSLKNYGSTPIDQVPVTETTYAGRELDAAWRAGAAQRIDRLRKADLTVRVVDAQGQAVPGAIVKVQQTRHAFPFGSAVAADLLLGDSSDAKRYQQFVEKHFNRVVLENNLKWYPWVEHQQRALDALGWLNDRGIEVRGHVLAWPSFKKMYKAEQYANDPQGLDRYIKEHLVDVVTKVGDLVVDWDVLNEPYHNHDAMDIIGKQVMVDWFKLARQHNANADLYINDFGILSGGGADKAHQDHYEQTIRYLLDQNAPLDGIGLQSHFLSTLTPPDRLLSLLDRFGNLGPKLMITELDIDAQSPELQADYLRDFLTVCFSHPKVEGVLMWGFWEGRHWRPSAALYDRDWSPRPAADAWQKLVFEQWWTRDEMVSDAKGLAATRAFKGNYTVTVDAMGKQVSKQAMVIDGQHEVVVTVGDQP